MNPLFLKSFFTYLQIYKPLAWAQLSHQKIRLAVAMTGVAFSNILIFTQLGLRALLFDGITLVPENLKGDLFLVSAYAPTIEFGSFPQIFLYKAAAIDGVASVSPLYIGNANWVNPETIQQSNEQTNKPPKDFNFFPNTVKILAFNPVQPVFNLPEVNQQLERLQIPGGVLFDRLSQPQLGPVPELFNQQGTVSTVMNRRGVYVVGLFSLGSTFFDKGHIIMSDWNYANRQGQEKLQRVSVGIITLKPGVEIKLIQQLIKSNLSQDVKVLTRAELLQAEKDFRAAFPEGKILNFGAAVGFIVGIVIVYQVLYTDVSDHLPEYATLKAMGYSDISLLRVVLLEAIILAVLGFIPGFFTSYGVYNLLSVVTRIPLTMRSDVAFQVFLLTLLMCAISGAIAMNKLSSADPADVF
jgi:putative ABC transport system permease protein